jgi:hypothetical protein
LDGHKHGHGRGAWGAQGTHAQGLHDKCGWGSGLHVSVSLVVWPSTCATKRPCLMLTTYVSSGRAASACQEREGDRGKCAVRAKVGVEARGVVCGWAPTWPWLL